jgi:hypothetical protein
MQITVIANMGLYSGKVVQFPHLYSKGRIQRSGEPRGHINFIFTCIELILKQDHKVFRKIHAPRVVISFSLGYGRFHSYIAPDTPAFVSGKYVAGATIVESIRERAALSHEVYNLVSFWNRVLSQDGGRKRLEEEPAIKAKRAMHHIYVHEGFVRKRDAFRMTGQTFAWSRAKVREPALAWLPPWPPPFYHRPFLHPPPPPLHLLVASAPPCSLF